jgi:endoribonuclease Nob1
MCAYIVADSSVFILGKVLEGELITVPAVECELLDIRSKSLLHIYGARVESPTVESLKQAKCAAQETGDIRTLSQADLEVLAKALEYGAVLATDDYAVQNVALHLGIKIKPIAQPAIKKRLKRTLRCSACGSAFDGEACPDCGTLARIRKRRIR